MFLSHFTSKLDAKGRVSIPAAFRSVLARDGFEGLFVYPSLEVQALDCGGNALLGEIKGLVDGLESYSDARAMFSTALMATSEILKVDAEGRIVLTERLKSEAGIALEVCFAGQGRKFQIWEPERFRAHLDEAKLRVRDMRRQLGSRAAAEPPRAQGARE